MGPCGRRLHLCVFYSIVGTLPTLKQILETKTTKNGEEAQTITNASTCQCKCTEFVDNPQVKKIRPSPSMPTPKEKVFETNCYEITKIGIKF